MNAENGRKLRARFIKRGHDKAGHVQYYGTDVFCCGKLSVNLHSLGGPWDFVIGADGRARGTRHFKTLIASFSKLGGRVGCWAVARRWFANGFIMNRNLNLFRNVLFQDVSVNFAL